MAVVSSVKEVFDSRLPDRLKSNPDLAAEINSSYKFVLTGDGGGLWRIDLTVPGGLISTEDGEAALTLTMDANDFLDLVRGTLNAQMAFMLGKLKLEGDMALAFKLQSLLRPPDA